TTIDKNWSPTGTSSGGHSNVASRRLEAYFSRYYGTPVHYATPSKGTRVLESYFSRYYGRPILASEEEGDAMPPLDGSPPEGKAGATVIDNASTTPKASAPGPGVSALGASPSDVAGTAEAAKADAAAKTPGEKE